jgi:hypothetical protein
MGHPSEESMLRARTALGPFVRAFNLSVNPEDLIADHFAVHARMMEAWQAAIDERKRSTQAGAD